MKNKELDSTQRFSDRVDNYVKYRPRYPKTLIRGLIDEIEFSSDFIVADVGSGTGFLAEIFLQNNHLVFGVEPNKDMRQAAEKFLIGYDNFVSVNGTAEATTLKTSSVDLVTVGQAFHWFD